ncbi:hypothetical protein MSG28_013759 [Choristoneura fumiferana]|uniref:Uncharacterized protein n=2 Tax=Choristoneura fumiferana TaxID=7141 RepID=A0ACC0K982_CHOFU|nr:hypothetical protein MSG28_013759 [Choristoneura fumiferana]
MPQITTGLALAHTLQGLGQDEGMYQQYIPLALHLADDFFLAHPSRDVQLLIACCIADVLRVYAPEAPYKDQEQVKTIFLFLINQLQGLRDPKDPAFKRYFYLLENLAYVKSFNMCFELEDCQEIFCALFSLMFKIVKMFSEPGSGLAKQYPALWRAFLGRFNDIAVPIRIKCVQYCMHFLVHHPDLRKDITETLKMRQHDAHEQVRYEVVMAIIATAQRDFPAVAESEDLLHFVRERTLDKKFKIRKEAMSGLAMIYRKFLTEQSVPPATEKAVQWIKDKILHGYYMTALEDRLLVERLLNTSLVPYTLPPQVRMKKLYYLMTNVDANATKAFIELQKHQLAVRRTVAEWVELHRKPPTPAVQKELIAKVLHISSKFLPESVKAQEFLNKFSQHMKQAPELLQGMEMILNPNVSCEVCVRTTLLVMLSFVFPAHFLHEDVLERLTALLEHDDESVAPHILAALTFLGKYRPLSEACPSLFPRLITLCKAYAEVGTPKQAKNAATLSPHSEHYRTAIVTLGHVAHNLPETFPVLIKNIVSRKIVKELLVREGGGGPNAPDDEWCSEEELPEETRCKLEGLKCMARWLLGLKRDELSAQKTFRMLNAFIVHKGDLLQQNQLSKAEMAWLRLGAGAAMLKICEQKGVGDQFTAEQFYNLSHLMIDEVPQVREAFAAKLHKGLSKGIPNKCLPLDFMGMYALGGREPERRLRALVRQYMLADVVRRREYIRNITVMKQCIWFILEPLITRNDFYCYGFYKSLVERMKNHKDALQETDDNYNYMRDFPSDARIPTMYFAPQDEYFTNSRVFLPPELQAKKPVATDPLARGKKRLRPSPDTINTNDVEPSEASDTQIQLPGLEQPPETDIDEPAVKRALSE